jgi:hypothetical protein
MQFPNGFESWAETHFEMVTYISQCDDETGAIGFASIMGGMGGLYDLAQEWTTEFEQKHQGVEWGKDDDTQYFDTLDEFLNQKNQKQ